MNRAFRRKLISFFNKIRRADWIAIGTWVSVAIFIVMLFSMLKMRESNVLTRQSLELTRQDLELQYRPAIYFDDIKKKRIENSNKFTLKFYFKNFGRVAADDVAINVRVTKNREFEYPLRRGSLKSIFPPQGIKHVLCDEELYPKDFDEDLFAHVFASYTWIGSFPKSPKKYYYLMGNILIEPSMASLQHLYWKETTMIGSFSTIRINYKNDDVEMEIIE
jgi:hypothetical protein